MIPSPLISPMLLLLIAIAFTVVCWGAWYHSERRTRAQVRALATEWEMQYSAGDPFGLAKRICGSLPIPGAADICVHNVIYGTEANGHRCIFSTEFTVGAVRSKTRRRCVISSLEPKPQPGQSSSSPVPANIPCLSFSVAEENLPLIEQYRSLKT